MTRRLPPEYAGWERHLPELRGLPVASLIAEAGSADPARRLAALTLVDVATTSPGTLLEWVRALPDPEVNQIAGAIQAQIEASDCRDLLRWAGIARVGFEQRGLATFLVLLFGALDALERDGCDEAAGVWMQTSTWICDRALAMLERGERDAFDDVSLFVFENHLDRAPLFDSFKALLGKRRELALRVSANPGLYLSGLPEAAQRDMLAAAERAGGIPLSEAWKLLHGLTVKREA